MEYAEKFKWDIGKEKEEQLKHNTFAEGFIPLTSTEYQALKERSEAFEKIERIIHNVKARNIYKE